MAKSKLKNTQALRQMLDGNHKMQTRKSVGWTAKSEQKREVGERWVDSNGVEWEQKDGYRIQGIDRWERMADIRKFLDGPQVCPSCKEPMTKRLDKKYYNWHKQCMDCVIEMEHQLRKDGTYAEYEQNRVKNNILSWLKEAEIEKEYLKETICKTEYVNSDGSLETWELPYDPEEMKQKIDADFEKLKADLLSQYGEPNDTGNTTREDSKA